MGCAASTPEAGETNSRPAKTQLHKNDDKITIPEVTWERDETWTEWLSRMERESISASRHDEFLSRYSDLVMRGVRVWLNERYPACNINGTIEDLGETKVCLGAGVCSGNDHCRFPCQAMIVLDSSYSGVIHALTLTIAKPPQSPRSDINTDVSAEERKEQLRLVPGEDLDSIEMRAAKHHILSVAAAMQSQGVFMGHALINIFVGADLVTCRFDSSPKPPTVMELKAQQPKEFYEAINRLAKDTKKAPEAFRGFFAPTWFRQAVRDSSEAFSSSSITVWDEGRFPFKLANGKTYSEPTRLLVTRAYEKMSESIEEVHFQVRTPPVPGYIEAGEPFALIRKLDSQREPGGIVKIVLVIGIDRRIIWPKPGDFAKSPVLKAGGEAVVNYAKTLHAQGKFDHGVVQIYMGTDESVFKLVGDPIATTGKRSENRGLPHPDALGMPPHDTSTATSSSSLLDDKSLERDFGLLVTPQKEHQLMGSESQFQAIKHHMEMNSKDLNPEVLNEQAILIAPQMAKGFLELNFPGCEITDEGLFPVFLSDGTETFIEDTRLIIARDQKQEPKSIVAVINAVPCPAGRHGEPGIFSTKTWVDTPEMKEADERLLALLKRLHAQGKVSEVECMAQTMMAKDATLYRFVEGQRFEDYSEERIQQIRWG